MDLLDTVSHLYENDQLDDSRSPPMLHTLPIGFREKNNFSEHEEYHAEPDRHCRFDRFRCVPCEECNDVSIDVSTLVDHLNGVFRQRINSEIENFRVSVNEIVTDQQMNFQTMFGLQQDVDPAQEVPMHLYSRSSSDTSDYQVVVENGKQSEQMSVSESPASTFNSYGATESETGYSNFGPSDVQSKRDDENALSDKYIVKLMTATLLIGNTLRREEYRVL